jgi:hypothetical protein
MRLFLSTILLAVCVPLLAQEPAAAPPQAPDAQAAPDPAKEENAPRQIPAKIVAGTVSGVDAEKHTLAVVRTDDDGKGATVVFNYDTRMRIYQRNKAMTVKDLVPGTGVKVHYAENRDGSFQVRRVMIDPPKTDAPTQPGGTGD